MLFALLRAMTLLAPLASAWSITFYTGRECNEDDAFNYATYTSTDPAMSSCMAAGSPAPGCQWFTNNGWTSAECTAPMRPQPMSFIIPKGTGCFMGVDTTDCLETRVVADPEADRCWNIEDWYQQGNTVWFKCWNT